MLYGAHSLKGWVDWALNKDGHAIPQSFFINMFKYNLYIYLKDIPNEVYIYVFSFDGCVDCKNH